MQFNQLVQTFWPYFVTFASLSCTAATAIHIVLKKRDARIAASWLGLVWFAPVVGVCLYWLFGINRVQRRAKSRYAEKQTVFLSESDTTISPRLIEEMYGKEQQGLVTLSRLTERITRQPLLPGNKIEPLINGDQAYPFMLSCIRNAQRSIALCTYIFDNDSWGERFRSALSEAKNRGVEVRVLIDGVGARYSLPPITWGLRKDGVKVACFMQTVLPWRFRYVNLRNHRKILVVDGRIGFTGGMNIQAGNFLTEKPKYPTQDLHFCLQGPVVAELQRTFAEDWIFTTGEKLPEDTWFPHLGPVASGVARGISDGPDEDFDKLRTVILGALSAARSSVRVLTPYFLPDSEIMTGLRIASLRGVEVQIILPGISNLHMVKWASDAGLEELVAAGCRIFLTPPPFDHSKVMLVDNGWVLLGSANWDPRSLALNFEFNVECYDVNLAGTMGEILDAKAARARELRLADLKSANALLHLRNRFFRLFSPYL